MLSISLSPFLDWQSIVDIDFRNQYQTNIIAIQPLKPMNLRLNLAQIMWYQKVIFSLVLQQMMQLKLVD